MTAGIRPVALLGAAWLGALAAVPAGANHVPPMPLEEQRRVADLVAVGRLGPQTTCLVAGGRLPCAELSTDVILKGAPYAFATRRYLILNSGIMELSVEHLFMPRSALFFLTRVLNARLDGADEAVEFYQPVRGQRSILPVDDNNLEPR